MSAPDPRAVENPISAIFDLAEDVNKEAPRLRRLVWYAGTFVGAWLALDFILIIQNIRHSLLMVGIFMALFILGVWTLFTLRRLNDFLDYYTLRHSVILSIRQDEPLVYAPQGGSALERLRSHLAGRNPNMAVALRTEGQSPANLKGRTGLTHGFEYYLKARPGLLWRIFGLGYPGFQLFIRRIENAPTAETFWSMVRSVDDVCRQNHLPPSRAIILWERRADDDMSEEAYERLMRSSLNFQHRTRRYVSSLELVIENQDGSYEFIPYIADTYPSASRAQ